MSTEKDQVYEPEHYKAGGLECIEVMEKVFGRAAVMNFCMLNAFKYIFRFRKKNGLEDVKKAHNYLGIYLKLCEIAPGQEGEET